MQSPRPESATLPRDFRFYGEDGERPTTPVTSLIGEPNQPSPPRPTRLKVRRRNPSGISAPTDQFLASVAAADIPIPTIELSGETEDEDMLDEPEAASLAPSLSSPPSDPLASPPRTPLSKLLTLAANTAIERPNWYIPEPRNPEDGTSRPSSSMSNPSDWSDDSCFGSRRISRPSETGSCTSPDSDMSDPFELPSKASLSKSAKAAKAANAANAANAGKVRETSALSDSSAAPFSDAGVPNSQLRSRTRMNAPWSQDMSDHLWNTYHIYLQDPTVTPFRMGPSVVPPEGVIHRVAREAKRSWRGPRAVRRLRTLLISSMSIDATISNSNGGRLPSPDTAGMSQSGSLTPTGERSPGTYPAWAHSGAATRSHLRELCKRRGSTSARKTRHFQSRSPTPFPRKNPRSKDRQRSPGPLTAFSTRDISLSLTTSSEAMNPEGPLAQLAANPAQKIQSGRHSLGRGINITSDFKSRCLGSPFSSHTYGPSSSGPSTYFPRPSFHPHADASVATGSVPSLRSPVRFDQPRSLNSTQKRRAQHPLEEELGLSGDAARPNVLRLFDTLTDGNRRRVRSRGFSLGDEAFRSRAPVPFGLHDPSINAPSSHGAFPGHSTTYHGVPTLPPPARYIPPRLGSPFVESGTSNTFPRRLFQQAGEAPTVRRAPFATVHHSRHSVESFDFGDGLPLGTRLRHLDQKLAEIRERETAPRSPPRD